MPPSYAPFGRTVRSTGNFGTFLETVRLGSTAAAKQAEQAGGASREGDIETPAKEVLRQLYQTDGLTQSELEQKTALSPEKFEPVAAYLEKAGMVDRLGGTLRLTGFAADALNIFDLG
jgi:hypothetical protein